jgi:hypothetical protein
MSGSPSTKVIALCKRGAWEYGGMIQGEPPLDELQDEPTVWLMAQSDGVSLDELRNLVEALRGWLTRGSVST